jgi:hypothetical protein
MIIHPPEKAKGAYVSRISDVKGRTFKVSIQDAKTLSIHKISNNGGQILKIWIPKDSVAHETITKLDETAMQSVLDNNEEWFQNALSEQHIYDYFQPCLDRECFGVIVSAIKPPRNIVFRGENIDDLEKTTNKEIKNLLCSCTFEAQGLYFYPKKFGVRWIIRDIEFHDKSYIDDPSCLVSAVNKDEVEDFWRGEIQGLSEDIANDIRHFETKIEKLRAFTGQLLELLETARKEKECSFIWNDSLNTLKTKVFEYKSGRL